MEFLTYKLRLRLIKKNNFRKQISKLNISKTLFWSLSKESPLNVDVKNARVCSNRSIISWENLWQRFDHYKKIWFLYHPYIVYCPCIISSPLKGKISSSVWWGQKCFNRAEISAMVLHTYKVWMCMVGVIILSVLDKDTSNIYIYIYI